MDYMETKYTQCIPQNVKNEKSMEISGTHDYTCSITNDKQHNITWLGGYIVYTCIYKADWV